MSAIEAMGMGLGSRSLRASLPSVRPRKMTHVRSLARAIASEPPRYPPPRSRPESPGRAAFAFATGTEAHPERPGRSAAREAYFSRPGEPLGPIQSEMESAFGADLASVRMHRDGRADALGARAVTRDDDIHLSRDEGPVSSRGTRALVAHEVAHVIQQRRGRERGGTRDEDEAALESSADAAAHAAVRGGRAGTLGAAPPGAVQRKPKPQPMPPGGNILYIGFNAFKQETRRLDARYARGPVQVTKITGAAEQAATTIGGKTFDLTTDKGIEDFSNSLPVNGEIVDEVEKLIKAQSEKNRDELAHVIAIYADTELDGKDRMSRVILSGHSFGSDVHGAEGALPFGALVTLAGLFPNAAAQVRHLMVAACLTGSEANITGVFLKAFPALQTFWGWTGFSPTDEAGAAAVAAWAQMTDKDPKKLKNPDPKNIATWAGGKYEGEYPAGLSGQVGALKAEEPTFNSYFSGDAVDKDPHRGRLATYYQRARMLQQQGNALPQADLDYVTTHAEQALRLRFYKNVSSNFARREAAILSAGYGAAAVPDFANLSRKAALARITEFDKEANGTPGDKAKAKAALEGILRDLDPNTVDHDWIDQP